MQLSDRRVHTVSRGGRDDSLIGSSARSVQHARERMPLLQAGHLAASAIELNYKALHVLPNSPPRRPAAAPNRRLALCI